MTTPRIAYPKRPAPPEPDDGVDYPAACDLLPVESMLHFVPQAYMQTALETWLDDPTALVAADMFIYYEAGDSAASVAPDVYVIPNVGNMPRRSYFLWLERELPIFAMEVASQHTYRNDQRFKRDLYERWGVSEYWQYDPEGRFLPSLLQGSRLVDGRYQPIPVAVDPVRGWHIGHSAVLNLDLYAGLEWFRFLDPATGRFLGSHQETERERRAAERERRAAERERRAAERGRLAAEQALDQERAARQELEAWLRQHGIEPPNRGTEA